MSNLTRKAFRAASLLREFRGTDEDILLALIPFLEPLLLNQVDKIYDPKLIALAVRRLYGWNFTSDIAEEFIPRLESAGWLENKGTTQSPLYIIRASQEKSAAEEVKARAEFVEIFDLFEAFVGKISSLLTYARGRGELETVLVAWLINTDAMDTRELRTQAEREIAQLPLSGPLKFLDDGDSELTSEDRYLCARFVAFILEKQPDAGATLLDLASVGLLTELITDFSKPISVREKSDLIIYLDAPIALDFLGLSGKDPKSNLDLIFEQLRQIGCQIMVFERSCDEMNRNLNAFLRLDASSRFGPTKSAILHREVSEDYVRFVKDDPEKALKQNGVILRRLPPTMPEAELAYFGEDAVNDFISQVHWAADIAPREHDAVCLASVMRLRRGHKQRDVFDSRHVLLTRNPQFARKARTFCIDRGLIAARHAGPVVHQRQLATMAWLRTGLTLNREVPKTYLLAACERVLNLNREVVDAARKEIQHANPERINEYNALLNDPRSAQMLMDLTLGVPAVITAENADKMLEAMKQSLISDVQADANATIETERRKFRERMDKMGKELAVVSADVDTLSEIREDSVERNKRRMAIIAQLASRPGRRAYLAMLIASIAAFVVGLAGTIVGAIPGFSYFTWAGLPLLIASGIVLVSEKSGRMIPGIHDIANSIARRKLQRELEIHQLSDVVGERDFLVDRGRVEVRGE